MGKLLSSCGRIGFLVGCFGVGWAYKWEFVSSVGSKAGCDITGQFLGSVGFLLGLQGRVGELLGICEQHRVPCWL